MVIFTTVLLSQGVNINRPPESRSDVHKEVSQRTYRIVVPSTKGGVCGGTGEWSCSLDSFFYFYYDVMENTGTEDSTYGNEDEIRQVIFV